MSFPKVSKKYALALLSASMGSAFQHGYHYGVINVAHLTITEWIKENKKDRYKRIPSEEEITFMWTIVMSTFSIGGVLGSAMTAYFANRFGHKGGLMWNNCIMFLTAFFLFFAKNANLFELLIIGRLLSGVNAGLNSGLCPIYLAEIAPVAIRGSTTAVYSFVFTVSFLLSHVFSLEQVLGNQDHWPLMFGMTVVVAAMQLVILGFCPESPRYLLITLGDEVKTKEALMWFRSTKDISLEMNMLKEHKNILMQLPVASMKTLFTDSIYRTPLLIALSMAVTQQLCGIVSILQYSSVWLEDVGLDKIEIQVSNLVMGLLLMATTFLCILLIDVIGRRMLFLLSLCGLAVDSIFLGVVMMLSDDEILKKIIMYTVPFGVVLFAGWYGLGTGTIPMVVTVELFHHLARPFAVSVVMPLTWLSSFIVSFTFHMMAEKLDYMILGIYVFMDLMLFLFIHMYLPETKRKTAKDIIQLFYSLEIDYTLHQTPSTY